MKPIERVVPGIKTIWLAWIISGSGRDRFLSTSMQPADFFLQREVVRYARVIIPRSIYTPKLFHALIWNQRCLVWKFEESRLKCSPIKAIQLVYNSLSQLTWSTIATFPSSSHIHKPKSRFCNQFPLANFQNEADKIALTIEGQKSSPCLHHIDSPRTCADKTIKPR